MKNITITMEKLCQKPGSVFTFW